jgi:hypothetical protein
MDNHKLIGKGSFSKVYRKGSSDTVLVISTDDVKECISLGWFPDSKLFPKVKRLGSNDDGSQTYTMRYYDKITAPKKQLNKCSYELYKELRKLCVYCENDYDLYIKWIDEVNKLPARFGREKRIIIEAIEALTNYGADVCFEISPRNIASTKSGRLILLDCFFFKSKLKLRR